MTEDSRPASWAGSESESNARTAGDPLGWNGPGRSTGLRPETLGLLKEISRTRAITDFPLTITREEARYLLDLVETPGIVPKSWTRALETGLRYALFASRQARQSGFVEYADWLDRGRIQEVIAILNNLRVPSQIRDTASPCYSEKLVAISAHIA
jgi:hypothetical protein